MQYYGLDQNNTATLAHEASKGLSYSCPECGGVLRVRSGLHRQIHFYHLHPPASCGQHKKTLSHLQTQWHLLARLPSGEAVMERPFSSISRIADIAWEKEKIVFEVQCSPISAEELEARCRDYASLGWRTVWILHDKRFNKRRIVAAEAAARKQSCYFTNISETGSGFIYDQVDKRHGNRRVFRGAPLPITVEKPLTDEQGALYFTGDLRHRNGGTLPPTPTHRFNLWEWIKRGYNGIFYFALEEACD